MSRAERAGRAKKTNNSHCPALRRRRRGEAAPPRRGGAIGRSSIVATLEGKSLCIAPFGCYPASRVSGRGPAGLGKSKLLQYKHMYYYVHTRSYICIYKVHTRSIYTMHGSVQLPSHNHLSGQISLATPTSLIWYVPCTYTGMYIHHDVI